MMDFYDQHNSSNSARYNIKVFYPKNFIFSPYECITIDQKLHMLIIVGCRAKVVNSVSFKSVKTQPQFPQIAFNYSNRF